MWIRQHAENQTNCQKRQLVVLVAPKRFKMRLFYVFIGFYIITMHLEANFAFFDRFRKIGNLPGILSSGAKLKVPKFRPVKLQS
jgi:hypothetical protein